MTLLKWVEDAGGLKPRVMRTHYGSLGAPDLVFEQEVPDPGTLEAQIKKVTANKDFQQWAQQMSALLEQSSKRELYQITVPDFLSVNIEALSSLEFSVE